MRWQRPACAVTEALSQEHLLPGDLMETRGPRSAQGHRQMLQVRCLSRWLGLAEVPQPVTSAVYSGSSPWIRLLTFEIGKHCPANLAPSFRGYVWPWFLGSPPWRRKQGHRETEAGVGYRGNPQRVCTHPGMGNRLCPQRLMPDAFSYDLPNLVVLKVLR